MLGVFSGAVVAPPEELVAAGSRTPSPKTRASELVARFLGAAAPAASVRVGDGDAHLAYSHSNQSPFSPRWKTLLETMDLMGHDVLSIHGVASILESDQGWNTKDFTIHQ